MATSTTRTILDAISANSAAGRWSSPSSSSFKKYATKKAQGAQTIFVCAFCASLWVNEVMVLRCLIFVCLVGFSVVGATQRPSVETELSEAGALVQAGRLEEAEAAVRKVLGTHPRSAEAHSLLGVILDQRGATADAEKE